EDGIRDFHVTGVQTCALPILARELDDAILHFRLNERELGLWVLTSQGDPERVLAHEAVLLRSQRHWLAREVLQYWKRVLKRLDEIGRASCRERVARPEAAGGR